MHYSSYSGGAHPNSWRVAVSFDLNTGEAVKIMELAEDGESLRAAVKENLLYQIRESDIWAEYGAEAFFEDYEDTVGNWADQCLVFDDNGLTVVFNPYTIAPYDPGQSRDVPGGAYLLRKKATATAPGPAWVPMTPPIQPEWVR